MADPLLFRFLRMRSGIGMTLGSPAVCTCALVHDTWVAVGLSDGQVMVANQQGHVRCHWRAHATPVNALSTDESGAFIASCSDDGLVVVRQLVASGDTRGEAREGREGAHSAGALDSFSFEQPLSCITLDPGYASRSEKVFAVGGPRGQLVVCRKNWYAQRDSVLHEGEGGVVAIAWRGNLVAWANERGVKIVDLETEEKITFVERPPTDLPFRCQLFWESDSSLFMAWSLTVQVLEVCLVSSDLSPDAEPRRCAQITKRWSVERDCSICGLAPFDAESVAVLCFVRNGADGSGQVDKDGATTKTALPELQVRSRETGEVLMVPDALPVAKFEAHSPENYSLLSTCLLPSRRDAQLTWRRSAWLAATVPGAQASAAQPPWLQGEPPVMYVATPCELLVCRVRDLDDQVATALKEHRYRDALDLASRHQASLRKTRLPDVAQQYLEDLLHHELFDEAAAKCPALFDGDGPAWEYWVLRFLRAGRLDALAPHIPLERPRLASAVYELVLDSLLAAAPNEFLATLKRWRSPPSPAAAPPSPTPSPAPSPLRGAPAAAVGGLYSLPMTMKRVGDFLKDHADAHPAVVEAQGLLFEMSKQWAPALKCYLRLDAATASDPAHVFAVIEEHGLYGVVKGDVKRLIALDRHRAGLLLVKVAMDEIPVQAVVAQLRSGHPTDLLWYLHTLFARQVDFYQEPQFADLHMRQVQLYADLTGHAPTEACLAVADAKEPLAPPMGAPQGSAEPCTPAASAASQSPSESPMIRFLRWSSHASSGPEFAEAAYEVCTKRREGPLWNEMVFLLSQQQRSQEALHILLTEVGDVRRAIDFIEGERDSALTKELWDALIQHSLDHPAFLTGVLDYAGLSSVELPSRLIKEIPDRMEIVDLRRKLVKIVEDYRFQLALQQGCRETMETWFHRERARLYQMQRRGRRAVPHTLPGGEVHLSLPGGGAISGLKLA